MVQFTVNKISIDLLRREETSSVRRVGRIKRDLNPVKPPSITLRLAVCIGRQICTNYHIPTTQQLRVTTQRIRITARIIFTDKPSRNPLIFINHLPLRILTPIPVEYTLRRHLFRLLKGVVEVGCGRRFGQGVVSFILLLLLREQSPKLCNVGVLFLRWCSRACS